jgi:hypothetical protein
MCTCFPACLVNLPPPWVDNPHPWSTRWSTLQVDSYRAQRRDVLRREYLAGHNPPQPPEGFAGQVAACWAHRVDGADVDAILAGGWVCGWVDVGGCGGKVCGCGCGCGGGGGGGG